VLDYYPAPPTPHASPPPKIGKFFVQPEKPINRDLKPENGIPKPENSLFNRKKNMNMDLKPENGIPKPENSMFNRKNP